MTRVWVLVSMQRRYTECVAPELAVRSRISREEAGSVFVQAETAAVAAKLRNLAPRILRELQARWPNLTGIHVCTQPSPIERTMTRSSPGLSEVTRNHLRHLSMELPEGALKKAVARLSDR
jgi:hypothetical protein